ELAGGVKSFARAFVERVAVGLVEDGRFLATHLEDLAAVPGNHLLADWLGLYVLGLALDGVPGASEWRRWAEVALPREARRQVGADGAHFEASTAYHRFALELLLVAHLVAR